MSGFERSTLNWARTAVIMSAIAALFVCLQWIVMRQTLGEMQRSGNIATHQLWQAIGNMNWMARVADGSLHQAQDEMEFTKWQSAASLKATIEQNRLDQRAWLGVKDTTLRSFKVGTPIEVQVSIMNSGKTPAFRILEGVRGGSFSSVKWSPKLGENIVLSEEAKISLHPAPAIPPNGLDFINMDNNSVLTQPQYDDVMSGSRFVYVVGRVEYIDVFRKSQWMTFCLQIVAYNNAPILRECDVGSSMSY